MNSVNPTKPPVNIPSFRPTRPSRIPTSLPTFISTIEPTTLPSVVPTLFPSTYPSSQPSAVPFSKPSLKLTFIPSAGKSKGSTLYLIYIGAALGFIAIFALVFYVVFVRYKSKKIFFEIIHANQP
mmetsp:Transcript_13374/g.18320  ORF Transcript_13374/g.18320 Transcript_13374/m.18320 type:complete len:125 (-) Transcript_13374:471-845(-)